MSESRSSRGFSEGAYVYFCGSFSYLSYLVDQNIGTDLFLLGRTQFGFLYNFIYMILTYVFGVPYNGSNHIVTQLTQYMVPIGTDIQYNALGTMLHDFMTDYGVYGSLIGVFIFALLTNQIEIRRREYDSVFYKVLYLYVLYTIVNSVLGYSFRTPAAFVLLLYIVIFCGVKKES